MPEGQDEDEVEDEDEDGLIGYVKSKPLGNGQIISIDILVFVMIIAVFHKTSSKPSKMRFESRKNFNT